MAFLTLAAVTLMMSQLVASGDIKVCGTLYSRTYYSGEPFYVGVNKSIEDTRVSSEQYPHGWYVTESYRAESDCFLYLCESLNTNAKCGEVSIGSTQPNTAIYTLETTFSVMCWCHPRKKSYSRVSIVPRETPSSSLPAPLPPSPAKDDDEVCATLYQDHDFLGYKFIIKKYQRYTNLQSQNDQYYRGWMRTSSYIPEPGCELILCNGYHLTGRCEAVTAPTKYGEKFLQHNSLSATCECSSVEVPEVPPPGPDPEPQPPPSPSSSSSSSSSSSESAEIVESIGKLR